MEGQVHEEGSVRHVEKRRISTCVFADRIAEYSLEAYRNTIPSTESNNNAQTCVATIVAKFDNDNNSVRTYDIALQIMAMGVGTKFINEKKIKLEVNSNKDDGCYGVRVRDSHAEVLARRAFRRQLSLEIINHLQGKAFEEDKYRPILQRRKGKLLFEVRPEVTLHMYTSSAPCGNATLKRFSKMKREKFDASLGPNDWPKYIHPKIKPHPGQQFSLLVKKDNHNATTVLPPPLQTNATETKQKPCAANISDEWCPPGTSIMNNGKGSIHTCSDKLARWNCLGMQGSLLSFFLPNPLYITTLTVGRKLTECICRRAICCRAFAFKFICSCDNSHVDPVQYSTHHVIIMGTSIVMDQGVIDMSGSRRSIGQDVRFHSNLCWVWWPDKELKLQQPECLNGSTGLLHDYFHNNDSKYSNNTSQHDNCNINSPTHPNSSLISTSSLVHLYFQKMIPLFIPYIHDDISYYYYDWTTSTGFTLSQLTQWKNDISPNYESAKCHLLTKHSVFKYWCRRHKRS